MQYKYSWRTNKMTEEDLMQNEEYRKDFENIAKLLGQKYGPGARSLLDRIKKRKEQTLRESDDRAH
jgi:hypothetical protein